MSAFDVLKQRQAVRNYEPREVEDDKIVRLLEAATWAPNDRLREPWHFYVIRGEAKQRYVQMATEYLQERFPTKPHLVKESLAVLETTPLVITVTADIVPGDEASSEDNEYAAACAIHSMWLAAKELGLGLVWRTRGVGLVRDERLSRFIGSPENKKIIGTVFIGYPAAETPATNRKPYDEKTTWL
ncbi:nitroreductase family protein [Paenibacillus beijingensis]|uniref:Cobalamin biosynthesis protein CbiY n=1 Tax=Paenibacillus beijingensis TaxID=1126833 RepID=A0A0D5NPR4_9BACL|nr:nitroreductase [Paenibacillus beijingensis]AJY76923.1 cobalamin biosynthesis protein CbiY [Paenibacillus beijingensis]